jgi:hypothetical protein
VSEDEGKVVAENSQPTDKKRPWEFQKGVSGNPAGRPKVEGKIRELARKHAPRAIRTLVKLMRSKNERVAVAAAQALLDRGFGRPFQAVGNPDGSALAPSAVMVGIMNGEPVSDAERAARVYLEVLGNPSLDLSALRFGTAPARQPAEVLAAPIASPMSALPPAVVLEGPSTLDAAGAEPQPEASRGNVRSIFEPPGRYRG